MASHRESVQIIDGVEVRFPYAPYQSQTVFMETVIKAVKNGKNALLESPTGTGKTLSLICSTLACIWHTRFKDDATFKIKETVSSGDLCLLDTIADLRNSIKLGAKTAKPKGTPRMNIIYASRTHSQLKQVIREAKKTSYANEFASKGLTTVVLGSRDQLCIHAGRGNVTGEALNAFCKKMVQSQGCLYYNGLKKGKGANKIQFYEFMDIEDLVLLGKSTRCCPFYASRDAHEIADITMLPYNYLLSPMSRDAMEIKLRNAVLIIDEAHNVESVAEAAAAFTVRQVDIARYLMALRRFAEAYKKANESQDPATKLEGTSVDFGALAKFAVTLKNLDNFLTNIPIGKDSTNITAAEGFPTESWKVDTIKRDHVVFRGTDILQYLMKSIGLNELKMHQIDEVIKTCIGILSTNVDDVSYAYQSYYETTKTLQEDLQSLNSMLAFLQHIFSKELLACPEYFHVFVTNDQKFSEQKQASVIQNEPSSNQSGGGWKSKGALKQSSKSTNPTISPSVQLPKVMSFECLQSTPSFLRLKNEGVRSIILTSGTLSPLADLENSIGGNKVSFDYKLSNQHIVPVSNVFSRIVTGTDVDARMLCSDFNTRSTPNYIKALGEALIVFSKCVPAGVLVFFGSYPVMEDTIKTWKRTGIFSSLEKEKRVFIESRAAAGDMYDRHSITDDTQTQLKEYNNLVSKGVGSMFIGVCRGKIAEGIDFSDDACRGVFLCGVPYPNPYEESIALKMDYLRKKGGKGTNDDLVHQWYTAQAIRAVNQAIGRVIRHINDYGVILLADRRFCASNVSNSISSWVTRNMETRESMSSCRGEITKFFQQFSKNHSVLHNSQETTGNVVLRTFTAYAEEAPVMSSLPGSSSVPNGSLIFKSRKISSPGIDIASSFVAGSNASANINRSPDSSQDTTILLTQKSATNPSFGWDVVNSWNNSDTQPLAKFRKPNNK
ncbi:DNA repair protein [Babesia ovis]|uniref:DNA repair protein n=1 Tax=Babesia ovis TaxID=5869 RepID=A0A9W5WU46_BABOV|nr:DNA repair protein [Babesia ovis]